MNTISGGISILNSMVQNIKLKREEDHLAEMIDYRETRIKEADIAHVKREEEIRNYIGNDPEKAKCFNEFDARLRKAYAEYDARKKSENE